MKKVNLNIKIIVPILSVLIISVAVMSAINYFNTNSTIYLLVDKEMDAAIINLENQMALTEKTIDIVISQMDKKNLALARSLSEILKLNPEFLAESEMTRLTKLLDVSEVHVTDGDGVLWWGNIPGYYGFDFHTSEQTIPFLKILDDPAYELAQEPMPNGALGIMFQYISVGRKDDKGIVQVGIDMKVINDLKSVLDMRNFIKYQKVGENGFAFIVDNGVIEFHPNESYINKNISGESWYKDVNSGSGKKSIVIDGEKYYAAYKNTGMKIIMALVQESEIRSFTDAVRNRSIIVSAAAVVFMGIAIVILSSSIITRPIKYMSEKLNLVSEGNLDIELAVKSNDEIGQLSRDFNSLKNMLRNLISDIEKMDEEVSRKNYEYIIDASVYYGGFKEIVDIINAMSEHRATETFMLRSAIENLNNAIQGIDEKVQANADTAANAKDIAAQTADYANLSNEKMEEMLKSINEINNSSQNLTKAIKSINSVSSQTKMMAINAAIEAVKAGEAGKSFSALADQIGVLSIKSESSIKESTEMLGIAKNKAFEGNEITNETVGVIQEMIKRILTVSEYVNDIARASSEQEQEIHAIKDNINKIATIMNII